MFIELVIENYILYPQMTVERWKAIERARTLSDKPSISPYLSSVKARKSGRWNLPKDGTSLRYRPGLPCN